MIIVIAGDREINSVDEIDKAVEKSGWRSQITEVVQGGARGVDKSAKEWARLKGIPCKEFAADWKNVTRQGARVKERENQWTKKMEKYDADAGHFRNEQMAMYGEALIAIQSNGKTPGTSSMIKLAEQYNLKVFIYGREEKDDNDYKYQF